MNANIDSTIVLEAGLAKAIARTWLDPEFAQKLVRSPKAALADMGMSFDGDLEIEVSRGTEAKWSLQEVDGRTIGYLTLAPCPTELNHGNSSEDLDRLEVPVAGPSAGGCCCG